jgi:hypothetical protein
MTCLFEATIGAREEIPSKLYKRGGIKAAFASRR